MKEWMKECLQKPQDHFSWPLMYRDRHGLTAQEVAGIIGHEQKTKNHDIDSCWGVGIDNSFPADGQLLLWPCWPPGTKRVVQ